MNIQSAPSTQIQDSTKKMFEILKSAQHQAIDLSQKMIKVSVTQAIQTGVGQNLDVSA